MKTSAFVKGLAIVWIAILVCCHVARAQNLEGHPDQALEWNQIFIETLIATNTAGPTATADRPCDPVEANGDAIDQ